ncbi:MAG TPA: four helix bundle protein [Gemmatimonas sp.]|nr:four helix bundle protein [Gemmatimonas sp.]
MRDHRQLRVWVRASALSVYVFRATSDLERGAEHYQRQLRRAVASIAATIAEGHAQSSGAQFCRYLAMSLGSVAEAVNHSAELRALSLVPDATLDHIESELATLQGMLLRLRSWIKRRPRRQN